MHAPVAALDRNRFRQFQHVPDRLCPRTRADHDLVATDFTAIGFDRLDRATGRIALEPGDGAAGQDTHAFGFSFLRQAVNRLGVVGITTALFVQHRGNPPGLPVVEQRLHVVGRILFTLDEDRFVTNFLLLPGDAGNVLVHTFRADLHVANGVITKPFRVGFPNADAVRHEFTHGRLVVVVAHHATGDTRGAGADAALVDHENVAAVATPGGLQLLPAGHA